MQSLVPLAAPSGRAQHMGAWIGGAIQFSTTLRTPVALIHRLSPTVDIDAELTFRA